MELDRGFGSVCRGHQQRIIGALGAKIVRWVQVGAKGDDLGW